MLWLWSLVTMKLCRTLFPCRAASDAVITVGADGPKSVDVEGALPAPGLLGSIQRSRVWRVLTYGMNYDIHAVSLLGLLQLPRLRMRSCFCCNCRISCMTLFFRMNFENPQ